MSESHRTDDAQELQIRQLEASLAAVTHELEAFTYSVSHDLRAPLRSISGYAQVLQEELGERLDPQHQHFLQRILESTHKLSDLIDGLLELSRAARVELHPRELDLTQIATEVVVALPAELRTPTLQLEIQPAMRVHADVRAMHTVLEQLLANALKVCAGRADGRIELTQTSAAGHTIVCVKDNGIGFDMRYADKLFAPFQRLHSNPALAGRGIGLALVQRLIARQGGRVWAEAAPDAGARFWFSLPTVST
jgi:signal transduction histidine kinase